MSQTNKRKLHDFKRKSTNGKNAKKRYEESKYDEGRYTSAHNDISWYVADGQILDDAARIPYSNPVGVPFTREPSLAYGSTDITVQSYGQRSAIPGILTQFVMPTCGYSQSKDSVLNVAMNGLYTFVRHLNSGARNYDPADLMLYIMATDSLYSMISWGTRIYATISTYHQANRYLPRILLRDQHIDYDDFVANLAYFRKRMNTIIPKVLTLMVPNVMPLFQRHSWLFSNYFIEGDTLKDQIYQYAPMGYYHFELDSDGAGKLHAFDVRRSESYITAKGFCDTLEYMLDPIIADEDFNFMSGDIYKAYSGNVITLGEIPDQLQASFNYDENVLLQFKNATCHSISRDASDPNHGFQGDAFDIEQDSTKTYLLTKFPLSSYAGYREFFGSWVDVPPSSGFMGKGAANLTMESYSRPKLITINKHTVDASDNMIITRGTCMFGDIHPNSAGFAMPDEICFGSEWYGSFTISGRYSRSGVQTEVNIHFDSTNIIYVGPTTAASDAFLAQTIAQAQMASNLLSCFKYHPEVSAISLVTHDNVSAVADVADTYLTDFQVDNYALVDFETLRGLHEAALLGEFNVPRIALQPTFK